ncbi:g10076 [Coccomyxa elongata]
MSSFGSLSPHDRIAMGAPWGKIAEVLPTAARRLWCSCKSALLSAEFPRKRMQHMVSASGGCKACLLAMACSPEKH